MLKKTKKKTLSKSKKTMKAQAIAEPYDVDEAFYHELGKAKKKGGNQGSGWGDEY